MAPNHPAPLSTTPGALPKRAAGILLALVAALLLFRLGAVPLLGPDEPRYARVAVEMSRSGDLVTPTLQGRPWLEKPALYYWLAAAAFRVLGENETAARLPAVAAALLLVGSTALVGARLFGGSAGLHAGFVLGTCVLSFGYGRAASMDMLLAAFVTAATGLLVLRLSGIAGRFAVPAAGVFMGLATLAKGPLGVVLPALSVAAMALLLRDRRRLRALWSPWALFGLLAVALPWYALVWRAQGRAFIDTFLLDHNVQRFTSAIHRHPGPPYYYLPVLLGGLFPWSGIAAVAVATARPRRIAADALLVGWLVAPLVFFSAAGSKLPGYVLPCLPPLALLAGRLSDEWIRGARPTRTLARIAALVTLALCAALATAPVLAQRIGEAGPPLLPIAGWSLVMGLAFSRRIGNEPATALRVIRVGAAGLLLLAALALPTILDRRESGRVLFGPAHGREVLAWGAWRTAWMAGFFYNDARVREVGSADEVALSTAAGPTLVLCGPAERRALTLRPGLAVVTLAEGPRGNALVRVEALRVAPPRERP